MDRSTTTESIRSTRRHRRSLSVVVQGRSVTRALKRFAAPVGASLLALSIACAPITGTMHITSDRSASGDRHEFVVHVDPTAFDSNSEVSAKLESVAEGQKLARDLSQGAPELGSVRTTFDLGPGERAIAFEMQAELLASVASDLGIMAEPVDEGLILASTGDLTGESAAGSGPQAFDSPVPISSVASVSIGSSPVLGNQTTTLQPPGDVAVSGIPTFSDPVTTVSTTPSDQQPPAADDTRFDSANDSADIAGSDES